MTRTISEPGDSPENWPVSGLQIPLGLYVEIEPRINLPPWEPTERLSVTLAHGVTLTAEVTSFDEAIDGNQAVWQVFRQFQDQRVLLGDGVVADAAAAKAAAVKALTTWRDIVETPRAKTP